MFFPFSFVCVALEPWCFETEPCGALPILQWEMYLAGSLRAPDLKKKPVWGGGKGGHNEGSSSLSFSTSFCQGFCLIGRLSNLPLLIFCQTPLKANVAKVRSAASSHARTHSYKHSSPQICPVIEAAFTNRFRKLVKSLREEYINSNNPRLCTTYVGILGVGFHLEVEVMPSSTLGSVTLSESHFWVLEAATLGWRGFQVCVVFVCALCVAESS